MHDLLAARETLAAEGVGARVVSLPDWNLFMAQPQSYRDEVLPPDGLAPRVARGRRDVRLAALVGERGTALGLDRYGASAPAPMIARELGITPEAVVAAARALLRRKRGLHLGSWGVRGVVRWLGRAGSGRILR